MLYMIYFIAISQTLLYNTLFMIPTSFFYLRTSIYLFKQYCESKTMWEYHFPKRKLKITHILEFRIVKSICSSYRKNDFSPCVFLRFYEFSKSLCRELFSMGRENDSIPFFSRKLFSQIFCFCFDNLLRYSFFYRFESSKIYKSSKSFLVFLYRIRKMFMRVSKYVNFNHKNGIWNMIQNT